MSEGYVVVSKAKADDTDYVRAVVHADEESANEYLAEVTASTPWQSHSVLSADDFAEQSKAEDVEASADDTEKGDEF